MKKHLRRLFVDSPNSLGGRARAKRAEWFLATFPDLADMCVLDLGGTFQFWQQFDVRPAHLTTLNPMSYLDEMVTPAWHTNVIGDACDPPASVIGQDFDLVFSNSTIEHVGDRGRRREFAEMVHKLADRHWVQTPNRAFPIEPHVVFPFEQFLPGQARIWIQKYWPLIHTRPSTEEEAREFAFGTELIFESELAEIFPKSRIERESVLPLLPPKSLVAVMD